MKRRERYPDSIRDAIAAEAMRRGLDSHILEQRCKGKPLAAHIDDYLTGRGPMQSNKVARLLAALGMKIEPQRESNDE